MSEAQEKNKALVHRFFEAHTTGDLAAVEEMMTPDFVIHHRGFGQERSGEVYIGGQTRGSLPGFTNAGEEDAFIARLAP
jgi:ketosteroid isomerase-like protein